VFFLAVDLIDNILKEKLLVGLRWIELHSFRIALASSSLDESGQEGVR